MNELDQLYIKILGRGIISIRNASASGDIEVCKAESEYLHEIPSLIGEANRHPHIYQATKARRAFMEWVDKAGRDDVHEFVKMWFAPVWKEIDRILEIEFSKEHD